MIAGTCHRRALFPTMTSGATRRTWHTRASIWFPYVVGTSNCKLWRFGHNRLPQTTAKILGKIRASR